ncbi:polyphosphate polymerase domain-containing protein [Actinotalea solisilvae]|uniref:polyphosphate polymerase domain-containing protein n=1 Tax=Actinotalea solisilvae TaxID=2072922 RepID=UPI0018F1D306|nr:polyphosphate polymerase domain-containing protein [Actinotalea solisilvae]
MTVTADHLPVTELAPLGLDELTARAALLTRVDRKYVVPVDDAARLLDRLRGTARVLEIDGERTFGYASVYFDTAALDSYLLAARRRPLRWKVRTRTYLASDERWLEVKTRDRRGRTVKHRAPHDADPAHLTSDGTGFVDAVLGAAGVTAPPAPLRPTLVTRYQRSTLHLPDDDSRVTLDTELVCTLTPDAVVGLHAGAGRRVALPDRVVVETKTAGHASAVDHLLWRAGHRPSRISKYATGLAALAPALPASRWRPVLRRHPFLEA